MCVCFPQRSEEGIRTSGTKVTDNCDPPRGRWESNLSCLHKQQVLLIEQPGMKEWILGDSAILSL